MTASSGFLIVGGGIGGFAAALALSRKGHTVQILEQAPQFAEIGAGIQLFAGTCNEVRTLLAKIESWRMWVLCDRPPVREWSKGRMTLVGDAAHPMLQYENTPPL